MHLVACACACATARMCVKVKLAGRVCTKDAPKVA